MTPPQILLAILAVSLLAGGAIFLYLIWITPEPECAEIWPAESAPTTTSLINLENLAEDLMQPTGPRDEYGHCDHPALPIFGEDTDVSQVLEAIGVEARVIYMESDCRDQALIDRAFEDGDCSDWTPATPAGDGWNLLEIFCTEDGPHALFVRRRSHSERVEIKRQREADPGSLAGLRSVLSEVIDEIDALSKFATSGVIDRSRINHRASRRALSAITHLRQENQLLKLEAEPKLPTA